VSVAIVVPVLGRPHRVQPLLQSITAATPEPHTVLFVADTDDRSTLQAIKHAGAHALTVAGHRSYATKINTGVAMTRDPLVFLAADDLDFQPGWLPAASRYLSDLIGVVGVNDLLPRDRHHATHFLMARWYAEQPTIDGGRGPLHEGYGHWFVDDELIATARVRNAYAYAPRSHVKHLHPVAGTAPDDATYQRGRRMARRDRRHFEGRKALWT
jgi:glycosyltransferase involved in cell wall biosynthesis